MFGPTISYAEMNDLAQKAPLGSAGLRILPFGNGAERMLNNKLVGVHFHHIDLNLHGREHIFRAVQEGIACAFRYGLDIMRENGMNPTVIRAGKANLFLSDLFTQAFVNVTGVPVQLYQNDGSIGAALGGGIGAGIFKTPEEAFAQIKSLTTITPTTEAYEPVYNEWKGLLDRQLAVE
jgi:xylulokinase